MKKKEEKIVKDSEDEVKECTCSDKCDCNKTCEDGNCECSCEKENIDDVSSINEEMLALKSTIESLNEKVKTSQAELINYRKRKDEETSNIIKFANKDLILELLPILDNFERALNMKIDTPEFQKYSDGYKILYSHLVDTLKKFGVEEIPAIGCEFDPNLHEAVMIGSDEDKAEDEVLEVFSKGYTLKGRVIRASKVRVNKL